MKKCIFLAVFFSFFILFGETSGTLSFTPKVETAFGLGEYHDDNKIGFGLGIDMGYAVIDDLSIEGGIGFVYWLPEDTDYTIWMLPINIGLKYTFLTTDKFSCSLIAGGGISYVHTDITNSVSVSDELSEYGGDVNYATSETRPSFYAGAEFMLKNIVLRPKFNMIFLENINSTSVWLEIGYHFGI